MTNATDSYAINHDLVTEQTADEEEVREFIEPSSSDSYEFSHEMKRSTVQKNSAGRVMLTGEEVDEGLMTLRVVRLRRSSGVVWKR